MELVKYFDINNNGRDFVVGDVHGMFSLLEESLSEVNFDPTRDRLFSVGDIVDRGGESHKCLEWLSKPWFHAVRGNHEQMCINAHYGSYQDESLYFRNGGGWWFQDKENQEKYVEAFKELPFMIELQTVGGVVGIVHAEVPFNNWDNAKQYISDQRYQTTCIWSRTRIEYSIMKLVEGISKVYVGHTILPEKVVLGNVHCIDTGAYATGKLILEEICSKICLDNY